MDHQISLTLSERKELEQFTYWKEIKRIIHTRRWDEDVLLTFTLEKEDAWKIADRVCQEEFPMNQELKDKLNEFMNEIFD